MSPTAEVDLATQLELLSLQKSAASRRRIPAAERVPAEILVEIFLCTDLVADDEQWVLGLGTQDISRIARPFRLAAVCKMWRDVMLACVPSLWSFISIPEPTSWDFGYRAPEILQLLIERSRDCPLSVLLAWENPEVEYNFTPEDAPDVVVECIQLIAEQASRWRRFEYRAPAGGLHPAVLTTLFENSTPLLEDIHVSTHGRTRCEEAPEEPLVYLGVVNDLLPDCPRLVEAELHLEHFAFDQPVPSLRQLIVDSPMMNLNLWDILFCTPNVEHLTLMSSEEQHPDSNDEPEEHAAFLLRPMVLDSLKLLAVTSGRLSETFRRLSLYTRTPHLTELHVPHSMIWDPCRQKWLIAFLRRNGDTLEKLIIYEDVRLEDWMANRNGILVDSKQQFWDQVCEVQNHGVWYIPRVSVVEFRGICYMPDGGECFLRFLQARLVGNNPVAKVDALFLEGRRPCRTFATCRFLFGFPWTREEWHWKMNGYPGYTGVFNASAYFAYGPEYAFEYRKW